MRSGVMVLAAVVLFALTTAGHGKNARLLNAVQQRMASFSQGAKQLFIRGKYALSPQKLAAGAGLALLVCSSISCAGSKALKGVAQTQQYVRGAEEIIGRHVHFVNGLVDHVGYVYEIIATDEVNITLYDGKGVDVKTSQVRGLRIAGHDDEGRQVIIDTSNEGEKYLHGFVLSVYDSNYYEIMIGAYVEPDDTLRILEFPYVVVISFDEIVSVFGEPFDD